jgi:uncharacterized protein YjeT (DUF2065 family)
MRAIPYLAFILGLAIAGLAAYALAAPEEFVPVMAEVQKRITLYGIAAIRVAIGVVLLLAAGSSRAPYLLGVVGVLLVLGGLITPFMAAPLRQAIEKLLSDGSPNALRIWSAIALAVGAFIVWATMPKRRK